MTDTNPEIGKTITAAGIATNVHDLGDGSPVLLIHGSGPGVSAYANWRLNMPVLAQNHRVVAPDCVGFGYTQRPEGYAFSQENWVEHLIGVLDALEIEQTDVVGNSFGGGMALALALTHPKRVRRIVLMGSVGVEFPITKGLDDVWGYKGTYEHMRELLDIFAYDRTLVSDELAQMRFKAASRPGITEAFAAMFPAPRQRWVEAMAYPEDEIAKLENKTLIIHGREDRVIPMQNALRLLELIPNAEAHLFGKCGHWTQIEGKDRFNALLLDFFG